MSKETSSRLSKSEQPQPPRTITIELTRKNGAIAVGALAGLILVIGGAEIQFIDNPESASVADCPEPDPAAHGDR